MATIKSLKSDVPSASLSSEPMGKLWVVCVLIRRKWSHAIGRSMVKRKIRIG